MLPNPGFNWKKQPEIVVWRNNSENGQDSVKMESYCKSGSVELFQEALKDNEVRAFFVKIYHHHLELSSFKILPS